MLKEGTYNFIGGILKLVMGLVYIPTLLYLLGANKFGLYSIISSIILFISSIEYSLGIVTTVVVSSKKQNDVTLSCLVIGIIFALAATFATFVISYSVPYFFKILSYNDVMVVTSVMRLGAFIVFFKIIIQFYIGLEQSFSRYGVQNIISLVLLLLSNSGSVIIASQSKSLLNIFLWQLISHVIVFVIHSYYCIRNRLIKVNEIAIKLDRSKTKEIGKFLLRMMPNSLSSLLFTQGDKLVVGSILGPELTGIYSTFTNISMQINIISSLPIQPLISKMNDLTMSTIKLQRLIKTAISVNILIASSLGIFVICFSTEITSLIVRNVEQIEGLSYILALLSFVYTVYSYNAVGYYVLISTKRENITNIILIVSSLLSLALIVLLASKIGLLGAALGNSAFLLSLILLYMGTEVVKMRRNYLNRRLMIAVVVVSTSFLTFLTNVMMIKIFLFIVCLVLIVLGQPKIMRSYLKLYLKKQ